MEDTPKYEVESNVNKTKVLKYQMDRAKQYLEENSTDYSEPKLEYCIIHELYNRIKELEEALSKIKKILYYSDSTDALVENEKYLYEIAEEVLRTP